MKSFRLISYIEGLSYLVLVFIAMPLKYLLGYAIFVKILGMAHGVLFVLFIWALIRYKKEQDDREILLDYFIYSLSPFGFILIENSLRRNK